MRVTNSPVTADKPLTHSLAAQRISLDFHDISGHDSRLARVGLLYKPRVSSAELLIAHRVNASQRICAELRRLNQSRKLIVDIAFIDFSEPSIHAVVQNDFRLIDSDARALALAIFHVLLPEVEHLSCEGVTAYVNFNRWLDSVFYSSMSRRISRMLHASVQDGGRQ